MGKPLRWLRNPLRLTDEQLVEALDAVLIQLKCANHEDDDEAQVWLNALALAYLREVESRISQGTLF